MSAPCRDEDGQALVEFALVAPMLIGLLCGVVYCGGLILAQENLAIAARMVARSAAIQATEAALKKNGTGTATDAMRNKALAEALPQGSGLDLRGIAWSRLDSSLKSTRYTACLTKTTTLRYGGKSAKAGIGVVFHGVTVVRNLGSDLAPIGRLMSQMVPSGGLAGQLATDIGASSVMPAELPIKGSGVIEGVLDLNPWIAQIVNDKNAKLE